MVKSFFFSKTIIINAAIVALTFLVQHYGELQIPPEYGVPLLAALNIVLRFLTVGPIKLL